MSETSSDGQRRAGSALNLALITARVREQRFGVVVANWFARRAAGHDAFAVTPIDLAQNPVGADLAASSHVDRFAERIGASDAVVVITPEYNHGYPGGLKNALDAVRGQWAAKPIEFVSYGGLAGGLRAVEQLRLVAAELGMVSIRETVSFHRAHDKFDTSGEACDPAADTAAHILLDQLAWWPTPCAAPGPPRPTRPDARHPTSGGPP